MTKAINVSQTANATFAFKNRIINGGMTIDQRNAGASVTPINGQYITDRFSTQLTQASKYSAQQSTDAPNGFINSLKVTSLSAFSVGASDYFGIYQPIEGLNCSDLSWGSASAKTVTLSFWVKSSLTGMFGGSIYNSAANRSYPYTYTVASANTWEQKTITIPGDTAGTWLTTNGVGIYVVFGLGAGATVSGSAGSWAGSTFVNATGATSVVGTNGATFYITGVQLEKGSTATPFEFRSIGQELALCQRYYYRISPNAVDKSLTISGTATNSTQCQVFGHFPVPMRIVPTALEQSGTAGDYSVTEVGLTVTACNLVPAYIGAYTTTTAFGVLGTVSGGLVTSRFALLVTNATTGASAYLGWSAEL